MQATMITFAAFPALPRRSIASIAREAALRKVRRIGMAFLGVLNKGRPDGRSLCQLKRYRMVDVEFKEYGVSNVKKQPCCFLLVAGSNSFNMECYRR